VDLGDGTARSLDQLGARRPQRPPWHVPPLTCKYLLAYYAPMSDADLLFKALADPGRRKLMDRLHANDGQTLGELCRHLDMTRQGVTQHLAVLEAANLVVVQWRGREKLHFLNPVPLQEIYDRWICKFERPRLKALRDLKRRLEDGGKD
jgi:DNA-binding transcriptional ArsR family regulator